MDDTTQLDKFLGCLVGLAVGDAVGTANEFGSRLSGDQQITDMVGGGPFGMKAGEWTDDTSMALCLAASLIAQGKYVSNDVATRFLNWRDYGYMAVNTRGCFDIGNTTSEALSSFKRSGNPRAAEHGAPANGSIMRLAPVPMFFADDLRLAELMSAESSRVTHSNLACLQACAYLGGLIALTLNTNADKKTIEIEMRHDITWAVPFFADADRYPGEAGHVANVFKVANGSYLTLSEDKVSQAGSVWATLEAALYTFYTTDNFRDGALQIVNRGDDADTVGAVFGQIAGAYYGLHGIPAEWVSKLAKHEMIEAAAAGLYHMSYGENVLQKGGRYELSRTVRDALSV